MPFAHERIFFGISGSFDEIAKCLTRPVFLGIVDNPLGQPAFWIRMDLYNNPRLGSTALLLLERFKLIVRPNRFSPHTAFVLGSFFVFDGLDQRRKDSALEVWNSPCIHDKVSIPRRPRKVKPNPIDPLNLTRHRNTTTRMIPINPLLSVLGGDQNRNQLRDVNVRHHLPPEGKQLTSRHLHLVNQDTALT